MEVRVCILLSLEIWSAFSIQQTEMLGGPPNCIIIQEKQSYVPPFSTPSFLENYDRSQCQVHTADEKMLKCGQTNVYIKPECVCSFYNVYEAKYHNHFFCPDNAASDMVTKLKCPDCKQYSLNNTGPCINGGKLTCKGDEVAPMITCQCPRNHEGMFCENKIQNVTRICDIISNSSTPGLQNCGMTGKTCVTYSKNKKYAYRCNETHTSHDRRELPLCIDTENYRNYRINPSVPFSFSNKSQRAGETSLACVGAFSLDVRWTILVLLSFVLIHLQPF